MDNLFLLVIWLATFLLALGVAACIADLIDRCRRQGCFRSRTRIDWRRGR